MLLTHYYELVTATVGLRKLTRSTVHLYIINLYSTVNVHASMFSSPLRHSPLHHSCPPGPDGAQKCVLLPE